MIGTFPNITPQAESGVLTLLAVLSNPDQTAKALAELTAASATATAQIADAAARMAECDLRESAVSARESDVAARDATLTAGEAVLSAKAKAQDEREDAFNHKSATTDAGQVARAA